jgi:hypothetical protein
VADLFGNKDGSAEDAEMRFQPIITLGTLLVIISMAGSAAAILWQAAGIQATVQASVIEEHNLREVENKSLHSEIGEVRTDVRDLRNIIVNNGKRN